MFTVLSQAGENLNKIQSEIKQKLQQIQYLDVECLRIQCLLEQLRQAYLEQIKYEYTAFDDEQKVAIQDISKLEEQLKEKSLQKVNIAKQIQLMVNKCTSSIESQILDSVQQYTYQTKKIQDDLKSHHLSEFGMTKQKGKHQKVYSPQIKAIIKEYYDEKETQTNVIYQTYCLCKGIPQNIISGNMIQCENPKCQIGWYHFECVGIQINNVPNFWKCNLCSQKISKVNKIIFENENQIVQHTIIDQKKLPNEQQQIVKRKRGRPRKIQQI